MAKKKVIKKKAKKPAKKAKKVAKKSSKKPKKVAKRPKKAVRRPKRAIKKPVKKFKAKSPKKQSTLIQETPEKSASLNKEMLTVRNFIEGSWKQSASKLNFFSFNPGNKQDVVAEVAKSNFEDIREAIGVAKSKFNEWKEVNAGTRSNILFRAAQLLEEKKEELSNLVVRETGFTKPEADDEVRKAISSAFYLAGEGARLDSVYVEGSKGNDNYMKKEPIGVFAIITPWCSPLEIPVSKLFAALVSGNSVVFKPAQETSTCAAEVVKALEEAGIPAGVLDMVAGSGSELGSYLTTHNDIDGVSFTGCTNVGKLIGGSCGSRFKKHELHLGDKSAMIVLDEGSIQEAIHAGLIGAFRHAGQRCNSTSRIIVVNKIYDKFVDKFVNQAKKLNIGLPWSNDTDVGPLINEKAFNRVNEYIRIGRNEDRAVMRCGGQRHFTEKCKQGFFYEPTVFAEVTPEMSIAQEEILGPVVSIIRARNDQDAIEVANRSKYGLVVSIFTDSISKAHKVSDHLDVGVVNINIPTTYSEVEVPYGGRKESGNSIKRGGASSLDAFTELKVVSVSKKN
jgi:alpha-ketoglutaric semialdehyde dehydrogenase